jgi:hypothetical protein
MFEGLANNKTLTCLDVTGLRFGGSCVPGERKEDLAEAEQSHSTWLP